MSEEPSERGVPRELLVNLAVDAWKLAQSFARLIRQQSPDDAAKYASQLRYFQKRVTENLEAAKLSLVNLEGQPFDAGAAASALNIADFDPQDSLVVEQMIEPIIMDESGIVRAGTVLLTKAS